jgi:hypothetical protein
MQAEAAAPLAPRTFTFRQPTKLPQPAEAGNAPARPAAQQQQPVASSQGQKRRHAESAAEPTPEKVREEARKAEAAAAQPLPDSDDDEDDSSGGELEGVKGVARAGGHVAKKGKAGPAENGDVGGKAPAASGWGDAFLKQNQVCAA